MTPSKVLALDIGEKRVGIALASTDSRLPQPSGAVINDEKFYEEINRLITENNVRQIVVGLPRGLDGQETKQTEYVRGIADKLHEKTNLEIILQDEAATSIKAKEELEAGKISYTKSDIDALSAAYILEDYLNRPQG